MITVVMVLVAMFTSAVMYAQPTVQLRADTVLHFIPGTGGTTGQGPAFFPANIFRGPDPKATETMATTDPREICALGVGGEIIVGVKGHMITNGPGVDFIIFENAFIGPRGRVYAEPATVSVSADGIEWHTFPYDSLTLRGCAGRTPTTGGDPFNPEESGGDGFDLLDVGLDQIRWIRLTDVCPMIIGNPQHPYYDPTLNGFDLDAITVLHAQPAAFTTTLQVVPRAAAIQVATVSGSSELSIADVTGRLLERHVLKAGVVEIPLYHLSPTCLLVTLRDANALHTVKVLR